MINVAHNNIRYIRYKVTRPNLQIYPCHPKSYLSICMLVQVGIRTGVIMFLHNQNLSRLVNKNIKGNSPFDFRFFVDFGCNGGCGCGCGCGCVVFLKIEATKNENLNIHISFSKFLNPKYFWCF